MEEQAPKGLKLMRSFWMDGPDADPHKSIQWQVIPIIISPQALLKVKGFSFGRTHKAILEKTGFITDCGRRFQPNQVFVRPLAQRNKEEAFNECRVCHPR